ncbi:MAG: DEAD/DEAH box helicase [Euryarchaeota archaeon]|nr:DEAD/DEAH box helicase [Euryarchaeota archaeon]
MADFDFGEIRFSGTLRPSQSAASDIIKKQLSQGEKQLHIVAPPGSGKTILGLYVWSDLVRRPALVLSPNSAIQAQWIARTSLFDLDGKSGEVGLSSQTPGLLTSLTYQSLTMVRTKGDDLEEAATQLWVEKLLEMGEAVDDESGQSWIEDLKVKNESYYEKQMKGFRKKARDSMSEENGSMSWLNTNSLKAIERLKEANIGLIILDECHHLTEHWGKVLVELKDAFDDPIVLGLTATPPNPDAVQDAPHYVDLLGEVDYEVPTPALVRDSNLAPYQDLCYFVRPSAKELEYITEADNSFLAIVEEISQSRKDPKRALSFPDWLYDSLETRTIPGRNELSWREFDKTLPDFSQAARAYLPLVGRTLPKGVPSVAVGVNDYNEASPMIVLLRPLLDRYVRFGLRRSEHESDHETAEHVTNRLRLLGYQITESGARPCASPVSRILAYASEKTSALSHILKVEHESMGSALRCVVVTDFEKTSSTALVEGIHDDEAGGAIGVFKALVDCDVGDQLDPVLMTGSTLLIDDDVSERFLSKARQWVEERELRIEFLDEPLGRFHHIHGSGADWAPRYYSTMVTEFFQEGFTKCLIGTRGLLGEGWDASKINVLVDLTTVTTSMSINQLRGRSMRLDKTWPNKVANNWDVVCLAEEFIKGFDDYDRFRKKHTNLFGVCDDGSIEKGVGHVHAAFTELQPEGVNEGMAVLNQEMLERSRRRSETREMWGIGQPFSAESRKSLEFKPGSSGGGGGLGFQFGKRPDPWTDASLNRSIITAVANAMWDAGLLPRGSKLGGGERGGGWYRYFIEGCTQEQSDVFAQALSEVFGGLEDARYIIGRSSVFFDDTLLSKLLPEVLAKYLRKGRQELVMYHRVPSCLAGKKEHAKWFQDQWNAHVSPGHAVYVHSNEGKQLLQQARDGNLAPHHSLHLKDVYL